MSRRGTAEEKTAKSDPIYRNRLVNMLVNRILKRNKRKRNERRNINHGSTKPSRGLF